MSEMPSKNRDDRANQHPSNTTLIYKRLTHRITATAFSFSLLGLTNFGANQAQAAPVLNSQMITITRNGSKPAQDAPADYFTGAVRINSPFQTTSPARVGGATVSFPPAARTAWHTHPLGQTLIVTEGSGLIQLWGGPIETINKGDTVWIPPTLKHWHGAAPTTGMTHIAIAEQQDGKAVEWLEKVTDEQYGVGPTGAQDKAVPAQPSAAQKLMGDVAPKLADLTDKVLFGDVWERPDLSKRDRSLVTISALIAFNRPDQLRSHLARAHDNGVTEAEIVETITHLAFYSGWPNAVTAVSIAREVFQQK